MGDVVIGLVVAMARNRVIGNNNTLPWRLPKDLAHFKKTTIGKPVIMGRKTFESIGRPLPGRANIVVTRQADWCREGVNVCHDLQGALAVAVERARQDGVDEAVLMGGAELYTQAMALVQRMYITEVHTEVDGDAWFPEFDRSEWEEVSRETFTRDERNEYPFSVVELRRKS